MASAQVGDRLSVVIMHHPSRKDSIGDIVWACRPFPVRICVDPEPDGPPSPLRTAKRAWATVADGATHHLVLQDDMIPIRGFADVVSRIISARPNVGISLSVQETSPRNAYLVRRAALAGQAWAPTSDVEWTPTNGLVLPAPQARALAAYLAVIPDEFTVEDEYVTPFCLAHGLTVLVAVPNLIEHGNLPSLSGLAVEGRRQVAVFDSSWSVPPDHWTRPACGPEPAPLESGAGGVAVELRESRCGLRFFRPGTDEPLEHPHTWYWHDWAPLVGIVGERVVDAWQAAATSGTGHRQLAAIEPRLALEIWATGYLTGALSSAKPELFASTDFTTAVRRRAAESWLRVGLSSADRNATSPADWDALVECMLRGHSAGHIELAGMDGSRGYPSRGIT